VIIEYTLEKPYHRELVLFYTIVKSWLEIENIEAREKLGDPRCYAIPEFQES
jgi:hypothetical protein